MPSRLFQRTKSKFREAFYTFLFPGTKLYPETSLPTLINNYYEGNATVFGAVNKIVGKIADVPLIAMQGETEVKIDPLKEIFKSDGVKIDYSFKEFRMHWHLFRLLLGESLTYVPRLENGNHAGQPTNLEIMPAQDILIETGGPDEPVKIYQIKNNQKVPLDPKDIYHSRLFLNVDYSDGGQFRGLSPLKVAAKILGAMNSSDDLVNKSYETGMPPGILYNKNLDSSEVEEQKRRLEKAWREKDKDVPVFGGGELGWINLGFSNLRDLQIVETDARGLRTMCNIWGIHDSLFSSNKATMNNMTIARKLLYEDRIMPDISAECEMYNTLFEGSGITWEPDYSEVPALQEDKEKIAKIYAVGIGAKAITRNEFRVALGEPELDNPIFGEEGLIEDILIGPQMPFNAERDQEEQQREENNNDNE